MKLYESIISQIEKKLEGLDTLERHKVIVLALFLMIGIFWTPFFTYANYKSNGSILLLITPLLGGSTSMVMLYILFKYSNIKLVSNVYIFSLYSTTVVGTCLTGILNSTVLMLFGVFPILAVFLIGSFRALIWGLVSWAIVFLYHYFGASEIVPLETNNFLIPNCWMIFICYISTTVITIVYDRQTKALIGKIKNQNDLLVQKAKLVAYAEMAKIAAHEINNPLSISKGNIQMILKKSASCENQEFVSELNSKLGKADIALERIAETIRNLKRYEA